MLLYAGDLAHAGTRGFNSRVSRSLDLIERSNREHPPIGVSYSGGKDSTVLLDLMRQVIPDVPAAFFDCGLELPSTYRMMDIYNVEVIKTQRPLIEMLKYGGYWGHRKEMVDQNAEFDFGAWLIAEPSDYFVREHELQTLAIGLRRDESAGRRMNAMKRGELYYCKNDDMWHLCPLTWWTDADVWAYIRSRRLKYNEAYDKMEAVGIPRKEQRVSVLLTAAAIGLGRFAWLRQCEPQIFRTLAAEFPQILDYT